MSHIWQNTVKSRDITSPFRHFFPFDFLFFKGLLLPAPCWWWKRAARCWRTAPGGLPRSDWPSVPSSRACGPGDARCSLTATDGKEQRFIMEFQFKHLPFLCFKKHLTHFLKKKKIYQWKKYYFPGAEKYPSIEVHFEELDSESC